LAIDIYQGDFLVLLPPGELDIPFPGEAPGVYAGKVNVLQARLIRRMYEIWSYFIALRVTQPFSAGIHLR
jgi:hypothetical protein